MISFADFSTKFNVFWPFVLFYCFKCNLHRSSLFMDHQGYKLITICCYKTFFLTKNDRKIRNFLTTFFKIFGFFSFFFLNGRQLL